MRKVKGCAFYSLLFFTSLIPGALAATFMAIQNIAKYGGKLLIKVGIVILVGSELIYLISETKGDFANGILFFADSQLNIYFLFFLVFYFAIFYSLGTLAGKRMQVKPQKPLLTGITFGLLCSFLLTILFAGFVLLFNNSVNPEFNSENRGQLTRFTIQNFIILSICIIPVWIWATKRMMR